VAGLLQLMVKDRLTAREALNITEANTTDNRCAAVELQCIRRTNLTASYSCLDCQGSELSVGGAA